MPATLPAARSYPGRLRPRQWWEWGFGNQLPSHHGVGRHLNESAASVHGDAVEAHFGQVPKGVVHPVLGPISHYHALSDAPLQPRQGG